MRNNPSFDQERNLNDYKQNFPSNMQNMSGAFDPKFMLNSMMQSETFVQGMMQMFSQHYMNQINGEKTRQTNLNESSFLESQREFTLNRQPLSNSNILHSNYQFPDEKLLQKNISSQNTLDNEQGQGIEGYSNLQRRKFVPLTSPQHEDDLALPGKSDFLQYSNNEFLQNSNNKLNFSISSRPIEPQSHVETSNYQFEDSSVHSDKFNEKHENNPFNKSKNSTPYKEKSFDKFEESKLTNSNHRIENNFIGGSDFDEQPIKGGAKNFEQLLEEKLGDEYHTEKGLNKKKVEEPRKKQFLKKGTRKFLSSAKDKPLAVKPSKKDSSDIEERRESNEPENYVKDIPKKKFLEKGRGTGGGNVKQMNPNANEKQKEIIRYEDLLGLSDEKSEISDKSNESLDKKKIPQEEKTYKAISYLEKPIERQAPKNILEFSSGKKEIFREPSKPLFDDQDSLENEESIENERNNDPFTEERENELEISHRSQKKSKLVEKYFVTKPEKVKEGAVKKRSTSSIGIKKEPIELSSEKEEEIVKKYVNEKIETLNSEIAKFKMENERVKKARLKYESLMRELNKEMESFKKQRQTDIEEFELMKAEELKKMKKERKTLERQNKVSSSGMTRKEREEIDVLKKQIEKLEEEHRTRESRHKTTVDRLKRENEELQKRCVEFKEEIKVLEKSRLEKEASPKKKPKETPRIINESKNISVSKEFEEEKVILNQNKKKPDTKPVKLDSSGISTPRIGGNEEDEETRVGIRTLEKLFPDYDFNFSSNEYYIDYKKASVKSSKVKSQNVSTDGKIQRIYEDGKKEIVFQNGVKREAFPDGFIIVHFINGDIKQTLPDGTVIYYFADAQTTQTTLQNGPNVILLIKIYRFPNNQLEIHLENGGKEIKFADGTEKFIYQNGEEATFFVDGTVQKVTEDKIKVIKYTNGQKVGFY